MIFVKCAPSIGHLRIVLPRLRDHHHHRVRQRTAAQDEQLQHVIEHGRVAAGGIDDGQQSRQIIAEQLRREHLLTRVHPVQVAADRVDFAVVQHVAERLSARPAREGVGAETRVDHGKRRLHPRIVQFRVELFQLLRGQHSLVDDGSGGEAGDVEVVAARQV